MASSHFFRSLTRRIASWRRQLVRRPYSHGVRSLHHAAGNRIPRWSQLRQLRRILTPAEQLLFQSAVVVLVVGVCWLGATMVRGYRTTVPAAGGTHIEAVVGTPELINPLFASLNDADRDIVRLVYSGLMRYNKDGVLVPDLAASFAVDDTETVYTFTLRRDVVWHDGEPFTSADVLYTFDTIQDETVGSPLYVTFQGVAVEVVDEYTLTFTLEEPFAPFLQTLTVGILPEHVWASITAERFVLSPRNLQPIGTGPYMFARLAKDATGTIFEYELERFDRYYREIPYIDQFTFMYYPVYDGEAGAIRALRQQAVTGLHFVPTDLREQIERKHIALHTLQLPQYTALFFNSEREPALADAAVREALSIALDKDRLVREALEGEGQVIEGPLLPGFPGYTDTIAKIPYDPSAANTLLDATWVPLSAQAYQELRRSEITEQLLIEARAAQENAEETSTTTSDGVTTTTSQTMVAPDPVSIPTSSVANDVEQILAGEIDPSQTFYRKNKDDVILEIDIVTVDTQEYRDAAALIESSWQEIGVTVNVAYIPAREFTRSVLRDRSYDVLLYGVILGSDPDQYPFWHSSQIAAPGLNLSGYNSTVVDSILESIRTATDDTTIADLYTKFQTTILTDRPAVFLYTPTYTYAQSTDIKGFDVSRIFVPADRLSNVSEWYIKTKGVWKKDL